MAILKANEMIPTKLFLGIFFAVQQQTQKCLRMHLPWFLDLLKFLCWYTILISFDHNSVNYFQKVGKLIIPFP